MSGRIGAKRSWNGQYTVPCDKVPSLPELTFYFGGKPYPLQGSDYVLNAGGTCISAFTGMDINLPGGELWIVGMYLPLSSNHIFTPFQVMSSSANTSPSTTLDEMPSASPSPRESREQQN